MPIVQKPPYPKIFLYLKFIKKNNMKNVRNIRNNEFNIQGKFIGSNLNIGKNIKIGFPKGLLIGNNVQLGSSLTFLSEG